MDEGLKNQRGEAEKVRKKKKSNLEAIVAECFEFTHAQKNHITGASAMQAPASCGYQSASSK